MSVLNGPRIERRRVMHGGSVYWGTVEGESELTLDDGRVISLEGAKHLAPCSPSKIICPHLTYTSRGMESRNKPQPT